MSIRLAKQSDFDQLVRLMQQLNPDDPLLDQQTISVVLASILAAEHFQLWVYQHNETLVGSIYLNIIPNLTRGAKPYAVIENVITDEAHRGQGVGKQLMLHALETARHAGCYKVMLMTGRGEDSQTFYSRCGFDRDSKQAFIHRF